MSVQTKTWENRKGVQTRYFASVWDSGNKKPVVGSLRARKLDAYKDEERIQKQLEQGQKIKKLKGLAFSVVAETWLEAIDGDKADNTVRTHTKYYNCYIKDIFGDQDIKKIQPIQIQRFINVQKKKYKASTINKMIEVLSGVFKFAIQILRIMDPEDNPLTGITLLKRDRPNNLVWNEEDVTHFLSLDTVKSHYMYPMFCIMLFYGCRPSEVCGFSEQSFDQKGLQIRRGYSSYGVITNLKNDPSQRFLPFTDNLDWLYKLIRHQLNAKRKKRLQNPDFANNNFLFVNTLGNPIRPELFYRSLKKLVRKNNAENSYQLPDIRLYDTRHTFATVNISSGKAANMVSSIMGNSPEMVMKRYAHVDEAGKSGCIASLVERII